MTLREAILHASIDHADAELLLAHVLGKNRTWLLAHPEEPLSKENEARFTAYVARRKRHEPVAYITSEKEFYGRTFLVDRRVLIPRPSTEALIDEVKKIMKPSIKKDDFQYVNILKIPTVVPADTGIVIFTQIFPEKLKVSEMNKKNQSVILMTPLIIDIGTGSGCIGITLALELPEANILCTDVSDDALAVARENAKRHGVAEHVQFQKR
ncbi:MAG: HemK/PrmC family methyltransferase, partial [Patescibacteria group bacterium]